MAKKWKKKGGLFHQPPLFFFSLPGGKGGKMTTVQPVSTNRESKYRRSFIGVSPRTSHQPTRSVDNAIRQRHSDRLRRIS